MRNHHLRARRLRLRLTQWQVGTHLPGGFTSSAQTYVSSAERGYASPAIADKVRRAIVALELEPRCARERRRLLERALAMPRAPAAEAFLIDYMIDALRGGEEREYDRVAELVGARIAKIAGDEYLDGIGTDARDRGR